MLANMKHPFIMTAATLFILFIAFATFLRGFPGVKLPFTSSGESETVKIDGVLLGNGCTDILVHGRGSPFLINKYGECSNSTDTHLVAMVVDVVFWGFVLGMTLYLLQRHSIR